MDREYPSPDCPEYAPLRTRRRRSKLYNSAACDSYRITPDLAACYGTGNARERR